VERTRMNRRSNHNNDMRQSVRLARRVSRIAERELWARAAGRCQFSGCNRILYKSPLTQESVHIAEKAHIYSFSVGGPRGQGPLKKKRQLLDGVENLLLVCHDCHRKIDKEKDGGRYCAGLLKDWKLEHEKRVAIVTGVAPRKRSTVVLYGANIGDELSPLHPMQAHSAMFPHSYPSDEKPICLSMSWEGRDDQPDYWKTEEKNLCARFDRFVRPRIQENDHFSIFGLAPIPLLVRLGTLFTDKIPAHVYQLRREPEQTWQWSKKSQATVYEIRRPSTFQYRPVLIIALSAAIARQRVTSVLGGEVSIWELALKSPHNDFLQSRTQLSRFREIARHLMLDIAECHGNRKALAIFPAMPVAMAVELGRIRMPKADMPWVVFDQNNKARVFTEALHIS